jgi:ArsR family transcriptional regulator
LKSINEHRANAKVFKAFCDETRLMVLSLLQGGEKCACVLLEEVPISQSTLSHHMKALVDSGIVASRKKGKWTYYSISATGCENAIKILRELTTIKVDESFQHEQKLASATLDKTNEEDKGCCS